MKNIKYTGLLFLSILIFSACGDDYLDTKPTSSTSTATVFETTDNAKMAINGMARLMVNQYLSTQTHCGEGTIKFLHNEYLGENFTRPALASGWYTVMNGTYIENNNSIYNYYPWYYYYMLIGNANLFVSKIDEAEGSEADKNFLKAQALTFRAYSYMQLVQFYCYRWDDSNNGASVTNLLDGLILRTEENMGERDLPLVSSGEIYKQIYADLDQAISLYESSNAIKRENVWEPNINVAYATYARTAITRKDYEKAETMAAKAREGFKLMSVDEYKAGFSMANSEWIWGSYGGDDQTLYYYGFHSYMAYDANTSINRSYPVCISKTLYDKIPATDIRTGLFLDPGSTTYSATTGVVAAALATQVRADHPTMLSSHSVAAYMNFKFSVNGSYGVGFIPHFRSSEMLLIEAEAKYFRNQEFGAQAALNELTRDSKRDPSYECTATGAALLAEIKTYRAIELWGEGFDWMDKKRYSEPIVRVAFADGGNFYSTTAITIPVGMYNKWTYVTPLIETQNNQALK
ncbi:MAG: RagB/SusD family nutrient uptake outer membrane protein [Tannerella sp.]|jgi:hypothetical protein|nr:RagB/SusD family nutrient uptake outer membrane protein [Tannerella sp.]